MFIEQEKSLVQKNYIDNHQNNSHKNIDNILSFFYKDNPDRQVNVSLVETKYKVSFPMSENTIHYATYFDTITQTKEYLDYLLETHL
tara:strand:+ start:508 stop:768 length:261 start_codon:yes stop_codon:yes gene_type:complete